MHSPNSVAKWHFAAGLVVAVACSGTPAAPAYGTLAGNEENSRGDNTEVLGANRAVAGRDGGTGGTNHADAGPGGAGQAGANDAGTTRDATASGGEPAAGSGSGGTPSEPAPSANGGAGGTTVVVDAGANGGAENGGGSGAGAGGASGTGAGGVSGPGAGGASGAGAGGASGAPTNQGGASSGGASNGTRHKRVFITHGRWDGNLVLAAHSFDIVTSTGLAGGDAVCNWVALEGGLGSSWVAWLSDSTHDACDRIPDVGPWYRMDGAEVFHDKAALSGNPRVPIDLDERGQKVDGAADADGVLQVPWTGTLANGKRSPDTCHDWLDNASDASGLIGSNTATTDARWSELSSPACNRPYHLYCFEQ